MAHAHAAVPTLAPALALAAIAGCDDLHVQHFIASRWDAGRECLEPSGTVDVYEADEPATCDDTVRCWISPEGDLYATRACEGAPGWRETSTAEDERCDDAVEAFHAGDEGRCDDDE